MEVRAQKRKRKRKRPGDTQRKKTAGAFRNSRCCPPNSNPGCLPSTRGRILHVCEGAATKSKGDFPNCCEGSWYRNKMIKHVGVSIGRKAPTSVSAGESHTISGWYWLEPHPGTGRAAGSAMRARARRLRTRGRARRRA